jgi:hypothetical protein
VRLDLPTSRVRKSAAKVWQLRDQLTPLTSSTYLPSPPTVPAEALASRKEAEDGPKQQPRPRGTPKIIATRAVIIGNRELIKRAPKSGIAATRG